MSVTVRLFARAKDVLGTDKIRVDLPVGATVYELRRQLALTYPHLAELFWRSALAVSEEFADDELALRLDEEVALLPPVSGG